MLSYRRIGVHDLNKLAQGDSSTLVWLTIEEFINEFIPSYQRDLFFYSSRQNTEDLEKINQQIYLNSFPPEAFQIKKAVAIHKVDLTFTQGTDFYLEYIDGLGKSRLSWIKNFRANKKKLKNELSLDKVSPVHFQRLQHKGNLTSYQINEGSFSFEFINRNLVYK